MTAKSGSSIIEVVIATALISVAIVSALSLTNHSQKQNTYAKGLAEASKYASAAADWIRSQRNSLGYATFATALGGTYCLNDLPASFASLDRSPCTTDSYITGTFFQRELELVKTGDKVKLTIEVSWMETTPKSTSIELELTKW